MATEQVNTNYGPWQRFIADQWPVVFLVIAATAAACVLLATVDRGDASNFLTELEKARAAKNSPQVTPLSPPLDPQTANMLAFDFLEVGTELRPDMVARNAHDDGIQAAVDRIKYLTASASVENDGLSVLNGALELLRNDEKKDGEAIAAAAALVEKFFSDYSGREAINFQSETRKLSASQHRKITQVLADYASCMRLLPAVAEETPQARAFVEHSCNHGRMCSYNLYPMFREFKQSASKAEMEVLKALGEGLKDELKFTEAMYEITNEQHFADVAHSVKRRLELFQAMDNWNPALLTELLKKALDETTKSVRARSQSPA